MKKKIIAAALVAATITTSIGMASCAAAESVSDKNISETVEGTSDLLNKIIHNCNNCQFAITVPNAGAEAEKTSQNTLFKGFIPFKEVVDSTGEALGNINSKGWNKGIKIAAKTGIAGLSLFTLAKTGVLLLGNYRNSVETIGYVNWFRHEIKRNITEWKAKHFPRKQVSANQAIKALDEGFKKIQGQEEPKRKMRKAIDGIIGKKQLAQDTGVNYKRGDVIYLVGPSGVGKTFSAEILAKALMDKYKPLILSPANVDLKSKETIISQLFGLQNAAMGVSGDFNNRQGKEPSSLVEYIKLNPKGVVIINEYDKMHDPGLDEIFRTIMDDGEVNIQGQKIDCSGVTFIITSNESTKSASGGNLELEKEDDGTGSRTYIKHDKAFMNRVNLIEFENLKYENYKAIAKDTFEKIANTFEKQYGIKVNVDGIIEGAAKRAEKINQGSRPIVDDMSNGFVQILMAKRREGNSRGKLFSASYDADKDEFKLSETSPNGEIINTTTESINFQEALDAQIHKEDALKEVNNIC